ncbi:MAG TPA: amino acid--[acyl-carrier-protein] ligase [Sphingomicrobium sp.]|jgi:seryl-tRNA synthetase|nr:amino acid--[acyl-carrier-protein] ligase [Sphingomicrobium sp.]
MANFREGTPEESAFLGDLVSAGLIIESGVPGVYGFNEVYIRIREAMEQLIGRRAADDRPEKLQFPPVLPKTILEDTGYLNSFPHLGACVCGFEGGERDAAELAAVAAGHGSWPHQHQTDLVLTPAACYPVYPAIAKRGPVPAGGLCVDAGSALVFRNEPSGDPARLQMFRQRELVRIGEPETVAAWRDKWRDRAIEILSSLGLEPKFDIASDPFFGRAGRMMGASQREQELKFEVMVPIASPEPTAVASFNYHRDHFTHLNHIVMDDGGEAHTACLGFGMERCTVALLRKHGLEPDGWPAEVREVLWG